MIKIDTLNDTENIRFNNFAMRLYTYYHRSRLTKELQKPLKQLYNELKTHIKALDKIRNRYAKENNMSKVQAVQKEILKFESISDNVWAYLNSDALDYNEYDSKGRDLSRKMLNNDDPAQDERKMMKYEDHWYKMVAKKEQDKDKKLIQKTNDLIKKINMTPKTLKFN